MGDGAAEGDQGTILGDASGSDVGGRADAAGADGADGAGGDAGSRLEYCSGMGPPIIISDPGMVTTTCTGQLAQTTFRYALCSCEDLTLSSRFETDAFDSRTGPYNGVGRPGGAVGTNGLYEGSSTSSIGGSLWVGGSGTTTISSVQWVSGELHLASSLESRSALSVSRDAWIAGDVSAAQLTVRGTLHVPSGRTLDAPGAQLGGLARVPVSVPPPCACAPSDLVDIASFVSYYRTHNDNADIGLDPDVLTDVQTSTIIELPCGRFYLSGIDTRVEVTIRITGRTALFIGGDVVTSSRLSVVLAPGAEVDVFIGGLLDASSELELGSQDAPAKARLYLGGSGIITLSSTSLIGGNFYAPRAEVRFSSRVEIFGSLFARRVTASSELTIHYDVAVLTAGEMCNPPGPGVDGGPGADAGPPPDAGPMMCGSCLECGNQACVGGACGACTDSSECCSPLVCQNGSCVPIF